MIGVLDVDGFTGERGVIGDVRLIRFAFFVIEIQRRKLDGLAGGAAERNVQRIRAHDGEFELFFIL